MAVVVVVLLVRGSGTHRLVHGRVLGAVLLHPTRAMRTRSAVKRAKPRKAGRRAGSLLS